MTDSHTTFPEPKSEGPASFLYIPKTEAEETPGKLPVPALAAELVAAQSATPPELPEPVTVYKGIVLYPDGSCRPNPGYGGLGVHGYTYDSSPPKKGAGHTKQVPTTTGYMLKSDAKANNIAPVTPLCYWDAYATIPFGLDNNFAEISAGERALQIAWEQHQKEPLADVKIWSDSRSFLDAANYKLANWSVNGWRKDNGDPVKAEHVPTWKNVHHLMTQFKEGGVNLKLDWLRGHSVHLGNNMADALANMGSSQSIEKQNRSELVRSEADGYWNDKYEKHPFIFHKSMYFNTRKGTHVAGEYFFGEANKDIELLGKRSADGRYSAVILKEPDPYIEQALDRLFAVVGPQESLMLAHLDRLFHSDAVKLMDRFGTAALYRHNKHRLDLSLVDKTPVVRELTPPRIALRAVEAVNELKGVLLAWKNQDARITATEITEVLFEKTEKKGLKLRGEFVVGRTDLKVQANYKKGDTIEQTELHLVMGVDSLDRNAFKKLEKREAKVFVVTWMESNQALRYATIAQVDEDLGIWCGAYSNLRIL